MVVYNRDLLDRAAIPYPTDDWTWDEFLRMAQLLTRDRDGDGRIDQWGAGFDRRPSFWVAWIWAGGGDVLCPGGRRASGCLDAFAAVGAIRWYGGWVTRWGIAPRPHEPNASGVEIARLFTAGRIAFMTVGHDAVRALRSQVAAGRLRVGFAPVPHRAGVPAATLLYATGYAVPAGGLRRKTRVELAADLAHPPPHAARGAAGIELAAGLLLPLPLAQRARGRYERALAAREATAVAAYLTVVTPPPRAERGAGYDLPQLLIRARALEELPGFSGRFEIYHATAPLVRATAAPLPAATLQRVRREVAVRWTGDAALAPLLDRDGWDVVGAVAARPAPLPLPVSPWSAGALLALPIAGAQGLRAIGRPRRAWRQTFGPYGVVALLFGVAVFADVRRAAGDATDRWLYDTRLLMQEAAARIPDIRSAPAALTPLARGAGAGAGAEIVPGDSGPATAWRRDVGGVMRAGVAVRLAPGRWIELRARPGEAGTAGWLPIMVGLAILGPLSALFAAWSLASAPRARRETVAAWGFLAPSALHLAVFSLLPLL